MEYLGLTVGYRDRPSGSTDLGNLSQIMPTLQVRLGICDDDIPIHSVGFADATQSDRGRRALLDAAKILAMTVVDYLSSPEIQKRAAEEFQSGAAADSVSWPGPQGSGPVYPHATVEEE